MSEYDAFGRKIDDAAPAAPTKPTTVPTGPPPMGRTRRNPLPWIVSLAVLAGIVVAVISVVNVGKSAVDRVRDAIPEFAGPGLIDRGSDKVPDQVGARKLFTPDGLRSALEVMERELPGRVANLSIRREYISAQVIRDGQRSIVNFAADAEVPEVVSKVPAGGVLTDLLSYDEISPTAPARLMQAANQRLNRSEADVEYFVVSTFAGAVQWGVYYEGGSPIAQGDRRGRYLRRIS